MHMHPGVTNTQRIAKTQRSFFVSNRHDKSSCKVFWLTNATTHVISLFLILICCGAKPLLGHHALVVMNIVENNWNHWMCN